MSTTAATPAITDTHGMDYLVSVPRRLVTVSLPRRTLYRRLNLSRLPGAAVDPFHPARGDGLQARSFRHAPRVDPHVSDISDSVLHMALDGLLQVDSLRARGMRADRRREPLANTREDHLAACGPGFDLGGHFRVYALLE